MLGEEKFKWDLKDVLNVFIVVFILQLGLFILLKLFGITEFIRAIGPERGLRALILFLVYILQAAAMIIPLWYIAVRKKHADFKDFAFKWVRPCKAVLWVAGGYIFYLGLGSLLLLLFYELGIASFGFEPQQNIFKIFGSSGVALFVASLIAVIIAPLVEEVFFRGFVLQTIAKTIGPVWGVLLTTLIFAAVHFEFQSIMPLIILAFVLNVIFIKTGSIWPGIFFHVLNNAIAFIVVLFGIVV